MNDELVGTKVVARVTRVKAYGVYLEFEGKGILVLIPDVAYERIPDLRARYKTGDEVPVRVLSYVEEHDLYKGTIKDT